MINFYGQSSIEFSDKEEYLEYSNKKYSINESNIYYISDLTKEAVILYPSFIFFIKKNRIITVEEISYKLSAQCPPNKLLKKLSIKTIDSLLFDNNRSFKNLVFKNLSSNEFFDSKNDLTAVFLFSIHLKKRGTLYIRQKKKIEKLGIKTIILSMDMPSIKNINDYSKKNQIRFKKS